MLQSDVSNDEIKEVLFSLHFEKAPGPDGYTAHFYKHSWNIVRDDFTAAVRSFFKSRKLLGKINATAIALVPKIPNPSNMTNYRPISCCNTTYKCISKIITNRLKLVISSMISYTQTAFISGRSISNQIMLMQELVRNYHKDNLSPRCALKIDIMKAFDSVSWQLILHILAAFHLPDKFKCWIEECITTPKFSISVNGALEGYFKGAKGLRQGDPLSPYLFLLVMEFFSRLLQSNISQGSFKYHPKCEDQRISHICFADDLFILCHADLQSIQIIQQSLMEFHKFSGLLPNKSKSKVYTSGANEVKTEICHMLGFRSGELPVKYLGVPLISTKLAAADCQPLIEKIVTRIKSWANRFLSYAGRLQIIKSILFSIQIYWSMHFILPKRICKEIEQLLRNFLWTGTEIKSSTHKVSWEDICCPKREGGLSIRRVEDWNKAAMMRHLWAVCSSQNSLWVQWCHKFMIKNKCFWSLSIPSDCSWTWRKILKLRDIAQPFIKHSIGNGNNTFLWLDNWHPNGPLVAKYGSRVAYDAGLNINSKVSAVIRNGAWAWPFPCTWELREITYLLNQVQPHQSRPDRVEWTISTTKKYNAANAWQHIRSQKEVAAWHKLTWFPKHIPKHSFILWLAIRGRLTTRDKLLQWGKIDRATCLLCDAADENLSHLFFLCSFSLYLEKNLLTL